MPDRYDVHNYSLRSALDSVSDYLVQSRLEMLSLTMPLHEREQYSER